MKIPLALLEARFDAPEDFRKSFMSWIDANGYTIDRQKTIAELVLYDQIALPTAAGVTQFFQGAVANTRTNMPNSFTRPEAEHFVILGIRLCTANNATINTSDWDYGANLAVVKNGYFDLTTNGVREIFRMPGNQANVNLDTIDQGMIWLSEPIFWAGQNQLNIDFSTLSAAAANDNLRIELHGLGLIS